MNSKFFQNNLSLKIISVIVAIILWLYAVSELNPEQTKVINDVPVEIINMDALNEKNLTLVDEPVRNITLRIRGLVNDIRKVNVSNLKAVLDLSEIDWIGTQRVELNIEGLLPREVKLDKIPEIPLTINKITTKIIPVVVDVTGEGGQGYRIHEPVVEPRTITIYGPQSLVDIVVQGLVQVNLDKDESTIKESLRIKLLDASGRDVDSNYLNLRQNSAMVTIPIYPIKNLAVKANIAGEPANGFVVEGITIDPDSVAVNGSASVIERLAFLLTETINIQNAVNDVSLTVDLMEEKGIFLEPGQPSRVNVVVSIKETTIDTDLTIEQVELKNIPEGYEAAVESGTVTVKLRGPFTVINPLTAQNLAPAVDLSQINTQAEGFEPGRFELPLIIKVPNRAELVQISSETITVNLQPIADEPVSEEEPAE